MRCRQMMKRRSAPLYPSGVLDAGQPKSISCLPKAAPMSGLRELWLSRLKSAAFWDCPSALPKGHARSCRTLAPPSRRSTLLGLAPLQHDSVLAFLDHPKRKTPAEQLRNPNSPPHATSPTHLD